MFDVEANLAVRSRPEPGTDSAVTPCRTVTGGRWSGPEHSYRLLPVLNSLPERSGTVLQHRLTTYGAN